MRFLGEHPLGVRNDIFKESWLAEYSLFCIHEVDSCKLKIHLSTKLFTNPFTSLKFTLALGFDRVYFTSFKRFLRTLKKKKILKKQKYLGKKRKEPQKGVIIHGAEPDQASYIEDDK